MSVFQAFVLGLVQGLTEFLPVSSSGHLILVPALLGWPPQPLAFDAVIHLGTLAAVLMALRGDLPAVFANRGRLGWTILAATVPALGIGFLFHDKIETALRSPFVVAASLAVWGALLLVADRSVRPNAETRITSMGYQRAMLIGFAQAIALIPGTSRSGVTITVGLFSGLSRDAAARFSFLLGIPSIAAAGAYALLELSRSTDPIAPAPLLMGFATSFAFGLLAIRLLLRLLKSSSYVGFGLYRIVLAIAVVLLLG